MKDTLLTDETMELMEQLPEYQYLLDTLVIGSAI